MITRKRIAAVGILLGVAGAAFALKNSTEARFLRLVFKRDARCAASAVWPALKDDERRWRVINAMLEPADVLDSDGGLDLVEIHKQKLWIPRRDFDVLGGIIADVDDDRVYGAGERGVHSGDVVLDCGANVGVFTRAALEAGARKVVAIEPAPENIACLRKNFAAEIQAGRVVVYPKGVWDRDDTLVLRIHEDQSGGDSVAIQSPRSREGPHVPLTTIDKLAGELGLDRVDFIKMDIEGAERQALQGARATVAKFHPRLAISTEHRPDDMEVIPALMHKLWPELKITCGPCVWVQTETVNRIQPEVVFAGP